jgi:hypothetical protein
LNGSLIDSLFSNCHIDSETERRHFQQGFPQTHESVGPAMSGRNPVSSSHRTCRTDRSREGYKSAVPLPEPSVRLSLCRTMLEEVLLLHEFSKGCVGQSEWCRTAGLCSGSGKKRNDHHKEALCSVLKG